MNRLSLPAVSLAACLASSALAQNDNAILVVDPDDAQALFVANYYAAARGLPASHVVYMDPDASGYADFAAENLAGLRGDLTNRGIEEQVDVVVVPPGGNFFVSIPQGTINDGCSPVRRIAIGSAFTTAFVAEDVLNGAQVSKPNRYSSGSYDPIAFDSGTRWLSGQPSTHAAAERYYIGAMLGYTGTNGNTLDDVLSMIDRSVAADGTHPAGTAYYMQTTDVLRSGPRHGAYPTAVAEMLAAGGMAQHLMADLPIGQHDVMGIMTGRANLPIDAADMTLLPGSFADHLTSFAGNFSTTSQTKMSRWIAKGASGTAGTVEEPCNYAGKFPHARFHVLYRKGLSLGEAWLRSVAYVPFQGLLYGDPQTRPYALPPSVSLVNPPAGPVAGVQVFTPTGQATAPGAAIESFEMLVDGVSIDVVAPGADLYLDTRRLADGWHELRVLARDDTPVAHTGRWVGDFLVDNDGLAVTLAAPAAGNLTTLYGFPFTTAGDTAREVRLLQNGRVAATSAATTGTLTVHGQNLGAGPVRVQAEALFAGGGIARSAPVTVLVDFSTGSPSGAPPIAFSFERTVRDDVPFVIELPATFEDDPASATYVVQQAPAQATEVTTGRSGAWRVFEPNPGATGSDTLVFQVTTAAGAATGTITLEYETYLACPAPANYCVTTPNSVGPGAMISWTGSTSVGANDLQLDCIGLPTFQFGLFFYGPGTNQFPIGDGVFCVGAPLFRLPVLQSDTFGTASYALDLTTPPDPTGAITVGSTWNFQYWYRDPTSGTAGFNFSNAFQATFCN